MSQTGYKRPMRFSIAQILIATAICALLFGCLFPFGTFGVVVATILCIEIATFLIAGFSLPRLFFVAIVTWTILPLISSLFKLHEVTFVMAGTLICANVGAALAGAIYVNAKSVRTGRYDRFAIAVAIVAPALSQIAMFGILYIRYVIIA